MATTVQIKGDRHGLRLLLSEEVSFPDLLEALEEQLRRGEEFFRGTALTVDVGNRAISQEEATALNSLLEQWGVELRAIGTTNRQSRGAVHDAGLRAVSSPSPTPPASATRRAGYHGEALLITRTIRSGQSVRHPGAVTVVGDVNPGAEIVAGGDVVVWGRLRGVVHAGAIGDEETIVCALDLAPTQLRIAGLAARSPEGSSPSAGPEVAHIENGRIVVKPWDLFRRG